MSSIAENLKKLNIAIPQITPPVANYVSGVISNSSLYVSGQLPISEGKLLYTGTVGQSTLIGQDHLSVEEAKKAAELCALNVLAVAQDKLGDLEKIKKLVKLTIFIASDVTFSQHPEVGNGASDLMVAILGEEKGKHARSAVGVSSLPLNAPVEIEAIFEI